MQHVLLFKELINLVYYFIADEDAPLFLGKTMVIFGFNPEDEQQLVSFIHEAGGMMTMGKNT